MEVARHNRDQRYPTHRKMMAAGLEWAFQRASYTSEDLKVHLIGYLDISAPLDEEKFLKSKTPIIDNYVAHVLSQWTRLKYHHCPNGGKHADITTPYVMTELGKERARQRLQKIKPVPQHLNR